MSNSNGKITSPVSLHADVYPVLGLAKTGTFYDTGWVCGNSHGRINKWSKHKPIRYNTPAELTDAQFRGTTADNSNGIYYGLKTSSAAGRLDQLHDADWEYLPPVPGTDWCRLTDFVGYDHNAKPNPAGEFLSESVYFNVERSLQAEITYTEGNTTGVDISDMLPANVAQELGDYYPCILIDGYARVLYSFMANAGSTSLEPVATTLRDDTGTWQRSWYADLDGLPNIGEGAHTCTVFLIRSIYQQGLLDLNDWSDVEDKVNAYNAFSVPGAVGVSIDFANYNPYTVLNVTKIVRTGTAGTTNEGIMVQMAFPDDMPDETSVYRVTITAPGVGYKEVTYRPGSGILPSVNFLWTELGILPTGSGMLGETVSGSVSFVDAQGGIHPVSHFDVTVTAS